MTERPHAIRTHATAVPTARPARGAAGTPDADWWSGCDGPPGTTVLMTRLGDRIDDRVAEAFDEQLAERLAEPGPLRRALVRNRKAAPAVVLTSAALGTAATTLSSGGATTTLVTWAGLLALNLAYFFRRA
ncbi:hypothetical protein [Yinghuangia seranimata]|uniref:hypothetical protein n=1 Tax=Yinghuangia seranimata TaxID=408067 RepID=UPI00248BB1E4|nr:hypothetical protein [Yinghuangia seranimata]MDI2127059.1 hypothetical protein [Yinghuangia seranimata]